MNWKTLRNDVGHSETPTMHHSFLGGKNNCFVSTKLIIASAGALPVCNSQTSHVSGAWKKGDAYYVIQVELRQVGCAELKFWKLRPSPIPPFAPDEH